MIERASNTLEAIVFVDFQVDFCSYKCNTTQHVHGVIMSGFPVHDVARWREEKKGDLHHFHITLITQMYVYPETSQLELKKNALNAKISP